MLPPSTKLMVCVVCYACSKALYQVLPMATLVIAGKPAATLLHLGPGLGNALANLHNAKKATSPIVNIVGEHATHHIQYNSPLTSDIEGIAWPVSAQVKTSMTSNAVGPDGAEAIAAAQTAPGNISTLILPADTAWNEGGAIGNVPKIPKREAVSGEALSTAIELLKNDKKTPLLGGTHGEAARSRRSY